MRAHSAFLAVCLFVFPMVASPSVNDSPPPTIVALAPSVPVIWPSDHKMVAVTIDDLVIDDTDPNPAVFIANVTCSAPNFSPDDVEITGPLTLNLRADKSGNDDRVYVITIEALDSSGNASFATTQVTVGHQGGKPTPF